MQVRRLRRAFGAGLLGAASVFASIGRQQCKTIAMASNPVFRFGVIADVQYADVDDAWNFRRTQARRYRGTLLALRRALDDWNRGPPLKFIADLGDIIDQQCESNNDSERALALVLQEWSTVKVPVTRLIGNHELYNFNRTQMAELIPGITPFFRSFQAAPGWKVVVLDPYNLNVIERGGGQTVEEGLSYLSQYNPNDLRAPRGSIDLSVGLVGLNKRFLPMGGAIRPAQLSWLKAELETAVASRQRTIMLSHLPFCPQSAVPSALLWNYDEVLEVLQDVEKGAVPLVLSGHDHAGGYSFDDSTLTHHVVLESPLNSPSDNPLAHGTVEVFHDKIVIAGQGILTSRQLELSPASRAAL